MTTIHRRLANLEGVFVAPSIFPPFTRAEIEDVNQRVRGGERLAPFELRRLEQYSPIVEGELLVTCRHGNVFIKRYVGIDLADV